MEHIVKPSSDIFFKYLFGMEEHKSLLISFINAVLEDAGFAKIVSVEIKNPFNIKTFKADKESVLDIKATDSKNRQYDIEAQSTGNEMFKHRALYYWAKLYAAQLSKASLYKELRPALCLSVLNFTLFHEYRHAHSCFLLREKKDPEYVLTDHLMLHFLELPKLNGPEHLLGEKLYNWCYYLANENNEEDEKMKILIKEDPDITRAHDAYVHFNENAELREAYEARQKWQIDYNTDIALAEEKGIEKGKYEKAIEDAGIMLAKGFDVQVIAEITGLSVSEIQNLK